MTAHDDITANPFDKEYRGKNDGGFLSMDDKCACALVIDKSGSIGADMLDILDGLHAMRQIVLDDPIAYRRVEVAIILYGNDRADIVSDFSIMDNIVLPKASRLEDLPEVWQPNGNTPMAKGLSVAIEALEQRKAQYKNSGLLFYRPWIVNLTDGYPTDDAGTWASTVFKARQGETDKQFVLFNLGTDTADFDRLKELSERSARLKEGAYRMFFEWLSASMKKVSSSKRGAQTDLPSGKGIFDVVPT